MAYFCGKRFKKNFRHGCFSGSAMYSPDAYILANKKSRRPGNNNSDDYGFADKWAKENKAMENDSCYIYDGLQPKKLNLVESILIEEDCSWLTPKSCLSLPKSTRSSTTKSVDKWKTKTADSKRVKFMETCSFKNGVQSVTTSSNGTGTLPLRNKKRDTFRTSSLNEKHFKNEKSFKFPTTHTKQQVSCMRPSTMDGRISHTKTLNEIQNRKKISLRKTSSTGSESRMQTNCMDLPEKKKEENKMSFKNRPLTEIQNRQQMALTNSSSKDGTQNQHTSHKIPVKREINNNGTTVHSINGDDRSKDSNMLFTSSDSHKEKKASLPIVAGKNKQIIEEHSSLTDKNDDLIQPSFIGIVNGPKPHVVLSETVRKENIKCKLMYCSDLPEKRSLFVEESVSETNDQMRLEELETTKLLEDYALKKDIIPPVCDESVSMSDHLKLTMSVASDVTGCCSTMKSLEDVQTGFTPTSSAITRTNVSVEQRNLDNLDLKDLPPPTNMVSSFTNPIEDTFTSTTLTDGSSTTFMSTDVTMGDTFATSVRSVSPVDTTFTNVTPMQSEISSMFSTLPNTPVHSSRKVQTVFNKNYCLSYVDDKHLIDQKYQSPTLVQLKLKKQKSVAKLVKAFEHLDCKKTITIDFDDKVQPMIANYGKEVKEIDENKLASGDVNDDINDINIKNQPQNLAFEKHTSDIKPVAKLETATIKETVTSSSSELGSKKFESNTTQIYNSKSNTAKELPISVKSEQEKESNGSGKKVRTIPEKLLKLWSASMLHEYTSDDFNVGQGVEVIVMNEDDPKWLYVQIAIDINGPANLQEKTAGFVPRSLVIPRFALPATRSSYRSLDSRKKKYFCNHHIRMSSNPETLDSNDLKNQKYRKSESLVDLTDLTPKTQIIATDWKEATTLNTASTNSSEKSKHEHFEKDSPKELSQSFSTDALIIESYTVITDYKPTEVDEVEVLTGEVVVVHAGQQRELDWMWVYVPRAERFGYIPAFCARPFALELPM